MDMNGVLKFYRPELADPVSATMERSQKTRFADAPEDEYHFMVERYGFVEESFFMWSLVPLVGPIDGMYSIVTEVTKQRFAYSVRWFTVLLTLSFQITRTSCQGTTTCRPIDQRSKEH
jgi:hypothetical protein